MNYRSLNLAKALCVLLFASPLYAQLDRVTVKTDVVYGHKDGMALTYDVFTPKENAKKIGLVFMVSGGWISAWAPPEKSVSLFQPLLDKGYTILAVRHGSSPKYLIPEIVGDVRLALKHITANAKEHAVDPQKLGVFGFSAGGHLSLMLGTTTNQLAKTEGTDVPHVAAVGGVFRQPILSPTWISKTLSANSFRAQV